ncbi:hypothetical protein JCM21714_2080 [Gracilibacillus boraciitolerans JCM 21714]|uniref:Conjugal transfer protein n=2 Tax=Gracilibacillus boraciitolerans TaxID=307521 RepID=W4VIS3_9BACI|nr:hypothetical protein JCM21714_2080 [Gracilibacillus boraciitolerans JCM 21714]
MGVISFWSLFSIMVLVVLVTMFGGSSSNAEIDYKKILEANKNHATTDEAIQFAENFTQDYFTWKATDEGKNNRKSIMSKYMIEDLDDYGGIDFTNMKKNAVVRNVELRQIEEKAKDVAHITFYVEYELKESGEDAKTIKSEKYFVVPVAYDGKTYGVYELPKFTFLEEATTVKSVSTPKYKKADTSEKNEIQEFLSTFFSSYAEDSQDKLNYLLYTEDLTPGLKQTVLFNQIKNSDIFLGENELEYLAVAEVIFKDPKSDISFATNYQLNLVKREGRYMVAGIDDIANKQVETIEETEEENNNEGEKEE